LAGGVASASSGGAVQQLMQLDRQINDRKTQMVREELQQKQGAEFDKAFVGSAIPAHIHMIAELEVLEKQGKGQLAQIAQQARPIAQQHLEHAKQLMRQLDQSSGSSASQAERSSSRRER
jgi:predicted outer membrane protein